MLCLLPGSYIALTVDIALLHLDVRGLNSITQCKIKESLAQALLKSTQSSKFNSTGFIYCYYYSFFFFFGGGGGEGRGENRICGGGSVTISISSLRPLNFDHAVWY